MHRVRKLKLTLWTIAGLATAVAIARFLFGLGATTNLSDGTPWGIWIGFDVMSGVALAAGGFIITATVYIFRLEKFHSIVRPAVLTAFLGYLAVAVGLLFDLGLPWNIWHMIIYWNPHSPLFEVGWCVMLYLTVLTMEFLPVPAEEFSAMARIRRFLIRIRLPLVITGIGLSTLHQSSLGSLFLIMPFHLHPLWYSPILPVMFFTSAIGLGLMMVLMESHTMAFFYRRKPETEMLAKLAGAARWVLLGYLVLRLTDLGVRGQLGRIVVNEWQTWMFWFELLLMVILPFTLLSISSIRQARAGQWIVAGMGVSGVVLNRLNVGGLIHQGRASYFPSWTELAISAGVVSVVMLTFMYVVEHFKVWEDRPADPDADPKTLPEFDRVGMTWLGVPIVAARTMYSLAFIIAAAAGFALITPEPVNGRGLDPQPAHHARGGDVLWIDANLDGYGVAFPHASHESLPGGNNPCARCHHMNMPLDQNTECSECHQDLYQTSDAFRHEWHSSPDGGDVACYECHPNGELRQAETAKQCSECHPDLIPEGATHEVTQYEAVGYVQALHQNCIGCHAEFAEMTGMDMFARCTYCHVEQQDRPELEHLKVRTDVVAAPRTVLPPY